VTFAGSRESDSSSYHIAVGYLLRFKDYMLFSRQDFCRGLVVIPQIALTPPRNQEPSIQIASSSSSASRLSPAYRAKFT